MIPARPASPPALPAALALTLVACAPPTKPGGGGALPSDSAAPGDGAAGGDGVTDTGGADGPLRWGPVQACDEPMERPSYTALAADAGFVPRVDNDGSHLAGSSLAVADFDQDGDLDIVQVMLGSPVTAYWAEGGAYVAAALDGPATSARLSVEDVDGDGLLDLRSADPLWWRGGAGLELVGRLDGFPGGVRGMDLLADDANLDGRADYFAVVSSPSTDAEDRRDTVVYSEGADGFRAAPIEGGDATGNAAQGSLIDWDRDGDLDVMVTNDMGAMFGGSRLYQNDDGAFTSARPPGCLPTFPGMAHTFGDFDRDGDEDIFVGGTLESLLLRREADGGCVEFSAPTGADPLAARDPTQNPMVWAATFLDFDNDGRLDILASEGDLYHAPGHPGPVLPAYEAPIDLLQQQEDGRFIEVGARYGLAQEGSHRAVLAEDLNGDGVLDLLVADVDEALRLYRSTGCTVNAWLRIEAPPHTTVVVEAGGERWTAVTRPERGVGASGPSAAHIGLGAVPSIDRITLTPLRGDPVELAGPLQPRRTLWWTP